MTFDEPAAHRMAASLGRTVVYVYLLRKGPNWTAADTPEVRALQAAHLAHLRRLGEEGQVRVGGPFLDALQLGTELRSMGVLTATSLDEARQWIGTDPMVQAGHLCAEVHAWMVPGHALP